MLSSSHYTAQINFGYAKCRSRPMRARGAPRKMRCVQPLQIPTGCSSKGPTWMMQTSISLQRFHAVLLVTTTFSRESNAHGPARMNQRQSTATQPATVSYGWLANYPRIWSGLTCLLCWAATWRYRPTQGQRVPTPSLAGLAPCSDRPDPVVLPSSFAFRRARSRAKRSLRGYVVWGVVISCRTA